MKKSILLLLFIKLCVSGYSQAPANEKTVFINDVRKKGIMPYDTTTVGHISGDMVIDWCIILNPFEKTKDHKEDTLESYCIHFFKPDSSHHLKNYQLGSCIPGSAFDRATYNWENDTTVTVNLIQNDSDKTKKLTLFYSPSHPTWSAGMITDDVDYKKSKKKKHK